MINDQELNKTMLTLKIIFSAIMFSLAVYMYVGLMVGKNPRTTIDADTLTTLRITLYGLSCFTLLITKPVKKFILKKGLKNSLRTVTSQPPEVQKYTQAMITACALSESIGVYGLVLFMLGKQPVDLYILIALSAGAMLQYRPKKDELLGLFERDTIDSTTTGIV